MRFSMFFSCTINAGMAAFVVKPVAFWETTVVYANGTSATVPDELNKIYFFGGLEHGLFLMVTLFMILVPDIPIDAQRRQEYNEDAENDLLDPQRKLGRKLKGMPEKVNIDELSVYCFSKEKQK